MHLKLRIHGWKTSKCGLMFNFTQSAVYNELFWLYSVWSFLKRRSYKLCAITEFFVFATLFSPDGDCKLKVDAKRNDI